MKFQIGDKVKYIGNVAFDDRHELFKTSFGIVTDYFYPRGSVWDKVAVCDWYLGDDYWFQWNVPDSYIKKIR